MVRNRLEEAEYRRIADDLGLSDIDVKNAVKSFFDVIGEDARRAGLNTPRKIYFKPAFMAATHEMVVCIPHLGRMGPSYDRYLRWRANESKDIDMMPHPGRRNWFSAEEIEDIARNALYGAEIPVRDKKMFHRIWLVGEDGKKQARQVIKKD